VTTGSGDPPVPDDAKLWRRVSPDQVVDEGARPSSAAFAPHPDDGKTSICVADIAGTPDEMMRGVEEFWLVEFTAGEARAVGFEIEDVGDLPYRGHANLVWSGGGSARRRAQKELAKACTDRWRIRRP
jgi:hypothetical protein